MTNVIRGRFEQAPAVRFISRETSAEVVDFLAVKVASQICAEDEIELVARVIQRTVQEFREMIERQERQFHLFGMEKPRA